MSTSGPCRLAAGGLIDRGRSIEFRFDGKRLKGFAGDSLAAALLANGVRIVSRSFKFRRPRGIFAAGIEEPNALLQLHTGARAIPSARATMVPLEPGLEVFSQSGWPSPSFDVLRVLDLAAPVFAAGFYNKTFIWPNWHVYEPMIRRMAGLGRTPIERDPDRYDVRNAHCDVLVIGAGVAGVGAAAAAAQAGARVILVDQESDLGGQCRWDGSEVNAVRADQWLATMLAQLRRAPDVQVMPRTTAVGYYDHDVVTLLEVTDPCNRSASAARERFWIVRARRIVLATGAIEQPLIFCNNDRPGVMLAGAARRYLRCQAIAPGRRVVIATNNDSAYALARDLRNARIAVVAVADSRSSPPAALVDEMSSMSVPVRTTAIPVDAGGFGTLSSVSLGRLVDDGASVDSVARLACDALLVSGGWSPSLHLFAQAGGKLIYEERSRALEPAGSHPSIHIVGAAAGITSADAAIQHAAACGALAAQAQDAGGLTRAAIETCVATPEDIGPRISPVGNTTRQWVDLRHDVTVADLQLALRENYTSVEHVKRYTTVGMSVDQGKTSSIAALEIIARLRRKKPSELGYTTMRPPVTPVTLGAIAGRDLGRRFAPSRRTPIHAWHVAHGALVEDFGEWQRVAVYPREGETRREATVREAHTVRTAVALFDASPLGKIEVHGPDAREFLDRFYINNLAALKPGRVRYGLMLRESGAIFDDGTVVEIEPGRMLITTTAGNASRVAAWLEEWRQCEWPGLRVTTSLVTDQWATVSLSGPRARAVLERLRPNCDISKAAFPHLVLRQARLLGSTARIYRVSFSGELTYEINVPADEGRKLWEALMHEGEAFGIAPYGIDALLHLRLEKGFLHVGTDTDATTVPHDVGWGKAAAAKTGDFVGKRSLTLPENVRPDRLQLIGLTGVDATAIPIGSHVRVPDSHEATDGWVTSASTTVMEGQPIALALLRGGRSRMDAVVSMHDGGRVVTRARVVNPPFYDPTGERMNG